ncbi:uncharacterized protein LOC108108951 [Drosophila eugracilis]|uniref:uncharacterized protein LOC108108951 n=1 Tax=Drosophila eugracilis TaxID=29029 RepID=UPI0007E61CCD|nr:uncharacterized protein LOC108108951 [Drosophila eugracilis]
MGSISYLVTKSGFTFSFDAMNNHKYSDILNEDESLLNDDEIVEDGIAELQAKLDEILANQNEILSRLSQVAHNKPAGELFKVELDYFPVTDPEELPNLDTNLSKPGNKYANLIHRILRLEGRIEPLKKNFSKIFEYDILMTYNYDGVSTKRSFKQFKHINKTIFGILKTDGYTQTDYIADIRAAFHTLKRRYHKRNHDLRRKIKRIQKQEPDCDWE